MLFPRRSPGRIPPAQAQHKLRACPAAGTVI